MCRGLPLQVGLGATPPQQPLGAAPSGVSDGIVCPYDDDFLTSTYKVAPCAKNWRHDHAVCPYAHSGEANERRPPSTYLPFMCCSTQHSTDLKEKCPLGPACGYAHSHFELWLHPGRFRTKMCSLGERCRRTVCFFAHSAAQLRVTPYSHLDTSAAAAAQQLSTSCSFPAAATSSPAAPECHISNSLGTSEAAGGGGRDAPGSSSSSGAPSSGSSRSSCDGSGGELHASPQSGGSSASAGFALPGISSGAAAAAAAAAAPAAGGFCPLDWHLSSSNERDVLPPVDAFLPLPAAAAAGAGAFVDPAAALWLAAGARGSTMFPTAPYGGGQLLLSSAPAAQLGLQAGCLQADALLQDNNSTIRDTAADAELLAWFAEQQQLQQQQQQQQLLLQRQQQLQLQFAAATVSAAPGPPGSSYCRASAPREYASAAAAGAVPPPLQPQPPQPPPPPSPLAAPPGLIRPLARVGAVAPGRLGCSAWPAAPGGLLLPAGLEPPRASCVGGIIGGGGSCSIGGAGGGTGCGGGGGQGGSCSNDPPSLGGCCSSLLPSLPPTATMQLLGLLDAPGPGIFF